MKFFLRCLIVVGVLACAWLGYTVMRSQRGLAEAERLLKRNVFSKAREEIDRYLWLHPRDPQALLVAAEILTRDESLETGPAIARAQTLLARIPAADKLGPVARSQQARLSFFVLHRPLEGQRLFEEAIKLDPDYIHARYLLWKLLDLTGRSDSAEPLFWQIYEKTPPGDRPYLMREWYMSQFFPASANPLLDIQMGYSDPSKPLQLNPEYVRLKEHRDAEPEEPVNHAALARWFQHDGDHTTALSLLEHGLKIPGADKDPYFLSILLATLFERGDLDRAREFFQGWPEPREGYEYWRWAGMLADEADRNYPEAIKAYDQALAIWPGPVDWRTMYRRANCLARMRQPEAAAAARAEAKALESQMDTDIHMALREALDDKNLQDRAKLQQVQDFYRALRRPREVAAWQEILDQLPAPQAAIDAGSTTR
jgi:tetratricopeptide (TPR) repeat protein